MGFRQGAYARIWSVDDKGKYSVANISISRKNKETGKYEIEFSDGFVRLVGDAHTAAQDLGLPTADEYDSKIHHGVSIQITSCDVTNNYSAKTRKLYTNFVIFGFDIPQNNNTNGDTNGNNKVSTKKSNKTNDKNSETDMSEFDEEDLPW